MNELDSLRQEAETLKNTIRVSICINFDSLYGVDLFDLEIYLLSFFIYELFSL